MTDEQVIRSEASIAAHRWGAFRDNYSGHSEFIAYVIEQLARFYRPADKAIFLDEMTQRMQQVLDTHIEACQRHKDHQKCDYEEKMAKVLYFIKQEISILPAVIHTSEVANTHRDTVFISYARADKPTLELIKRHFKPLENRIDFWDDSRIQTSQQWLPEIRAAMGRAKVALMLLSADFFASKFVTQEELPKLLKAAQDDGVLIMFLVVKPCMLEEYPELTKYQGLNYNNTAFIKMSEAEQEDLCVNLATQIRNQLTTPPARN